jgi:hypothetical protein
MEEDEEIQELDAEEQQDGEQPQQGDGLQQGSTAEARAQQTGKKRARSVANSSTKSEVWKDFKFSRRWTRVFNLARFFLLTVGMERHLCWGMLKKLTSKYCLIELKWATISCDMIKMMMGLVVTL